MVRIDFRPLLQGQTSIAKVNNVYKSLIIRPTVSLCEIILWEVMGWESPDVVIFDLGPKVSRDSQT